MAGTRRTLPFISLSSLEGKALAQMDFGEAGLSAYPRVEITGSAEGLKGYAVLIDEESRVPALPRGSLAVFSPAGGNAMDGVYSLALREGGPAVKRLLSGPPAETGEGAAPARVRKSFMTPTPLHVPGSRVSPIPGDAHERLFLMALSGEGPVVIVSRAGVLYLHPLRGIVAAGNFSVPK